MRNLIALCLAAALLAGCAGHSAGELAMALGNNNDAVAPGTPRAASVASQVPE